jgi:carboxypeptidase family protein
MEFAARLWTRSMLVLFVCAASAAAQITTGTLSGTINDAQGGVIPGATVVLINEQQGTRSAPVISGQHGEFVFINVTAATYTLEVDMPSFKPLKRSGVAVSPGARLDVGTLTLDIGARSETVTVKGERPQIQTSSGERSFTVSPEEVEALPNPDRNFATLAALAPGVLLDSNNAAARIGGGGATNFMMDGVGTMDTGSNRQIVAVNVESIAEVKVLASSYQAEYGRSSGLQITAVTKSGTNRIRGSAYDIERNSDWNSNSKTNKLNGDPKLVSRQRDWGYSIGGPIGKPGGGNKLFFFYAQEFEPRTQGNEVIRRRMPTALERSGDFSRTLDNNGNPYPYIRDALTGLPCNSSDIRGCFQDGGIVGKIPANRLYETGLNILNMFPMPNLPTVAGTRYNYEITRPEQSLLSYQPAVRVDYQPTPRLRTSAKYTGWLQRKEVVLGTIPGFSDTIMQNPTVGTWAATANYVINATTFLEATYGRSGNELAGCSLTGGAPNFCTSALPVNAKANRINAGLGDLPFLFPDANVLDPQYYAYSVMNAVHPPIWDGSRIQMPPSFTWNGRVSGSTPQYSPDNIPFPSYLNVNHTQDVSISVTKLAGRHQIKSGFFNTHNYKAQQRGGWAGTITFTNDSNNPLDSQFPFANAALGVFDSYNQASKYVEGVFIYNNTEGYVQDGWKVNSRLTLDYGVRLVHQQPQYDSLGQASNFLQDRWNAAAAPLLYGAGCANNVYPCSGSNRQARNPETGELLGPFSNLSIGTLVPGTGNPTNGLFLSGQGIARTTYTWPFLAAAPRFGMAYDLTGRQRMVWRGAVGLFFDRPDGNSIYSQVQNPPTYKNITVRYGALQTLGAVGLTSEGPPALSVYEYHSKLPSSWQWNTGMQFMLPWYSSLDVAYVGHHSFNLLQNVNLNTVDFGAAFLPQNQDPTLASNTPGATAVSQDRLRAFRGYGAIQQQWGRGWRTYHSVQVSAQRRFHRGISFGVNDTISLYDHQSTGVRLQHDAEGRYSVRADQAQADRLLGRAVGNRHIIKGNAIWELPHVSGGGRVVRTVAEVVNGWRLSSIWTAVTGSPYTVGYSYQSGGGSVNITGSPDYGGRVRIVGNPGTGCSSNPYTQFNPLAFQGPLYNSVGLESGNDYLRGCTVNTLDLSIARTIRLGGSKNLQLRVDMFNAPNAATVTSRATTINFTNPNDAVTITNLPYDASGNLIVSRSLPRGAAVGVATDYQSPRRVQLQARFSF